LKHSPERVVECPLFVGLEGDDLAVVVELLRPRSYEAGEHIYTEGDRRQQMSIVLSGRCEVVRVQEGADRQLAVLEQGDVFGELSFFDPAPHSATVRALTKMEVLALVREDYDDLLRSRPTIAHRIAVNTVKLVSDRLRSMDEWVFELLDRPDTSVDRQEWQQFRAKLYTNWQF